MRGELVPWQGRDVCMRVVLMVVIMSDLRGLMLISPSLPRMR